MQADGHRRLAERLDGLVQHDAAPFDRESARAEEIHEILGRDRTEELALLGGLPALLGHEGLDAGTHTLGVATDAVRLGVLLLLDVLQVLEVARAGGDGELLGQEEVAREPIGNVAHLAASTDRGDVVEQNHLHGYSLTPWSRRARWRRCAPA